uniref:Fibrinogen C domain-containing protein 1-B n=1 Tax=Magallana gigas TaxID=29159 RepID=K1PMC4_MAGGI
MKFTTRDEDNNRYDNVNCATMFRSAWWFDDCYYANPNGQYTDSEKTGFEYITWYHCKNPFISLKTMRLMFRPRA